MSIESLAALIHPSSSIHKFLAMLDMTAYSDESESQQRVFCVSGYLARLDEWKKLEAPWAAALKEIQPRLTKEILEFKMRDCVAGENGYESLEPPEREEIQRQFIKLINALNVCGFATGVNLRDYGKVPQVAKDALTVEELQKPYFLAFRAQVGLIAHSMTKMPRDERVSFVFDEQKEYRGRAKDLYAALKQDTELHYRARLGGIAFENSARFSAIQASDVIAYESRRYLNEVAYNVLPKPVRWQWRMLNERKIVLHAITSEELGELFAPVES